MATTKQAAKRPATKKKAARTKTSARKATPKKTAAAKATEVSVRRAASPFEEMERRFSELMGSRLLKPSSWEWPEHLPRPFTGQWPRVDIIDQDKEVIVKVEAPGVAKEDLEVTVTDHTLSIQGRTSHESKEEEAGYFRREISSGSFRRSMALPQGVDPARAKASFDNGILRVAFPKTQAAKKRTVKVD
jgi:HSP20 family protein